MVSERRSYVQSPSAGKLPINAMGGGDAANFPAQMLFECRRPGHQLKPEPVIDHGKAPGGEIEPPAIDASDGLAFGRCVVDAPAFGGELGRLGVQFALAQRGEQIPREGHDPPLTPGETHAHQMIGPFAHGRAHLRAEAGMGHRRLAGEQLAVQPGSAGRFDLRFEGKVGSDA